jgi:hypothetical protein
MLSESYPCFLPCLRQPTERVAFFELTECHAKRLQHVSATIAGAAASTAPGGTAAGSEKAGFDGMVCGGGWVCS